MPTDYRGAPSTKGRVPLLQPEEPPTSLGDNDNPSIDDLVAALLRGLGKDPLRDASRDPPRHVSESLAFLTQGYQVTPETAIGSALFAEEYDQLVLVRDSEFASLCEHRAKALPGHYTDGRSFVWNGHPDVQVNSEVLPVPATRLTRQQL